MLLLLFYHDNLFSSESYAKLLLLMLLMLLELPHPHTEKPLGYDSRGFLEKKTHYENRFF